jgi:hypothetical protein
MRCSRTRRAETSSSDTPPDVALRRGKTGAVGPPPTGRSPPTAPLRPTPHFVPPAGPQQCFNEIATPSQQKSFRFRGNLTTLSGRLAHEVRGSLVDNAPSWDRRRRWALRTTQTVVYQLLASTSSQPHPKRHVCPRRSWGVRDTWPCRSRSVDSTTLDVPVGMTEPGRRMKLQYSEGLGGN